jgi:hypothetical protein
VACEGPGVGKWLYSGTRVEARVISVILVQRPPSDKDLRETLIDSVLRLIRPVAKRFPKRSLSDIALKVSLARYCSKVRVRRTKQFRLQDRHPA